MHSAAISRPAGAAGTPPIFTRSARRTATAWAYFYNAPLGRAQRIESGDYLIAMGEPDFAETVR